jgi:hypothetical protein
LEQDRGLPVAFRVAFAIAARRALALDIFSLGGQRRGRGWHEFLPE